LDVDYKNKNIEWGTIVLTLTNVIIMTIRRWKCINQINITKWRNMLKIMIILKRVGKEWRMRE